MDNASQRKQVRDAEKKAKLIETQEREFITHAMSTTHGRLWMWRRLEEARCFSDPFSGDALLEAYHKGQRNFGLGLLNQLMMYCPDQYIQMTREANERHTSTIRDPDDSDDDSASEQSGGEDGDGGTETPNPNLFEYDPFERDVSINRTNFQVRTD